MADLVRVSDDVIIRKATAYEAWLSWQMHEVYGGERQVFVQDGVEYYVRDENS